MSALARQVGLFLGAASLATGLLGGCQSEAPDAPGLIWRATTLADSAGVGDPFGLRLEAQWSARHGTAHLAWLASPDTLLLIGRDSTAIAAPEDWVGRRYDLLLLAPRAGLIRIPPAALVADSGDTLAWTAASSVVVGGRILSPEDAALRPLAPMASLRGFPWWIPALAALLLGLIVTALLVRRRRRALAAGPPAPPPIPPAIEFREALERLLAQGLKEQGRMRDFVQELSWILRRYLGRRWEEPALEATRPEILRWLPRTPLKVGEQQQVAAWLETTDDVKFAGRIPLLGETDALVEKARAFVQRGEQIAAEERRRAEEARLAVEVEAADRAGGGEGGE